MASEQSLSVTVILSPKPRTVLERALLVAPGTTAGQAIRASGLLAGLMPSDIHALELGIWGRKAAGKHALRNGDRVELYRPLAVDPKVARRERFSKQGAKTAGLFKTRRSGAKAGY